MHNAQPLPNHQSIPLLESPIIQDKASAQLQWNEYYQKIKSGLQGQDQQKQGILRKRLLKFFHNYSLEENRFYVPRREINSQNNPFLRISDNCIILYGIDFLSENKISQYFAPFETNTEFYDDSHCCVSFTDSEKMMQAIYTHLYNNKDDYLTFSARWSSNYTHKINWTELKPYNQLCFERRLWARCLTNEDIQSKVGERRTTAHQTYLMAKNKFFNQIANQKDSTNNSSRNYRFQRQSSWSSSRERSRDKKSKVYTKKSHDLLECPCLQRELLKKIIGSKICKCCQNSKQSEQSSDSHASDRNYGRSKKHKKQWDYRAYFKSNTIQSQNKQKQDKMEVEPSSKKLKIQKLNVLVKSQSSAPNQASNKQTLDKNQDQMISSLLKELEKYHFTSEEENFDKFLTKQGPQSSMDQDCDYSAFNIITEE